MTSLMLTNSTIPNFLINILTVYGLPWLLACVTLFFTLFIVYKILKRKGLIDHSHMDIAPIINELTKINLTLKGNGKILDLILGRQNGYLSEDQSRCILNSIIDTFCNNLIQKVMEIYQNNNIDKYELVIKKSLKSELDALIRDNYRECDLLPNIKGYLKTLNEQLTISEELTENLLSILKNQKNERDIYRRCRNLILSTIKNEWLL